MGAGGSTLKRKRGQEKYITVVLNYGGRFITKPNYMYFGGNRVVYEHVDLEEDASLDSLKKCCEDLGMRGNKIFYAVMENAFKPLSTENDLAWASECTQKKLHTEICVEAKVNEGQGVVDDEIAENSSSDSDDVDYIYKSEAESSGDDDEWSCNVDPTVDNENEQDSQSEEDVVFNDVDFDEKRESDEESTTSEFPTFNKEVIYNPEFVLGMTFESRELFKKAIQSHAINTKRCLYLKKNDKIRVYARCRGEACDWACHALKVSGKETFQVKTYIPTHKCPPNFHVTNLSSTWLGQKHVADFQCDPKRNVKGWRKEVMRKLNVNVSCQQAYIAKNKALEIIEGVPDMQYSKLWDYAQEIRNSNPGSTFVLDIDNEGKFSKLYICFDAVKRGFKNGCRPFIGVDGCWLKGPRGGILLAAVGVDPGNAIYPIAYAIVPVENRENWEWFLIMLKVDLDIGEGDAFTFMSDKQKGLILALKEVFPLAEHRHCARHMHNNYVLAGFRGLGFKRQFWDAAFATTVGVFNETMRALRVYNEAAAEWLVDKPPCQWSRSHFSFNSKCDTLLNNVCESFNASILDARDKPILTMLEWIRQWLMERFQHNRDMADEMLNLMLQMKCCFGQFGYGILMLNFILELSLFVLYFELDVVVTI